MLSDSSTPGQQLDSNDAVTTHGRGGDHRAAAVLQNDVVVAVCQDRQDCWLHVFRFSQPWDHKAFRLPQASAIAVCSAEKSRGPGHFTLTLDSPSAVLEGCVDDRLQLSQVEGRLILNNQSLPSASDMDSSQATSSLSTLLFFRHKKKRRVIVIDSATQQIKLFGSRNSRLIWEWPDSPFQNHQFERLCMFAYPDENLRDRCQEYFLAVCDRARRKIIILSLDHGYKLDSLDIPTDFQPQTIFVHKHILCTVAAGIAYFANLNSIFAKLVNCSRKEMELYRSTKLHNLTNENEIARASVSQGKHSRGSARTLNKSDEDATCTILRREQVEKDRRNNSKQEKALKHGVDQNSIETFKCATFRLPFSQTAKNIYRLVLQGIPRMKTLLSSQCAGVEAENAPVTQNALPQNTAMTEANCFKQTIFDYTTTAAIATGKCLAALLRYLKKKVQENLTYDRDVFFEDVMKAIKELLTTFKQMVAISCAVAIWVYNLARNTVHSTAVSNKADLRRVASRTRDTSQSLLAPSKQVHGRPDVKDPKRPRMNVHEKGTSKANGSLGQMVMNEPFQSTVQPQALPLCNESHVDTEGKSQNLFQSYPMNNELKDAEMSRRRRRAMNEEAGSTKISQAVSRSKSTNADPQQDQPDRSLYRMNKTLREAELARRQRRGENRPIP